MSDHLYLLKKYYSLVPWCSLIETILWSESELPYTNIITWSKKQDTNDTMIVHYNCFHSVNELVSFVNIYPPVSFHLGARMVMPVSNTEHKILYRSDFVLDYDIEKEDGVCGCDNKSICSVCWATVAIPNVQKIVKYLLSHGFTRVFTVFSGRRGIHIWIVDRGVRMLTDEARKTIVSTVMNATGVKLDTKASDLSHSIKLPYSLHADSLQASLPFNPFDNAWSSNYPQFNLETMNVKGGVHKDFLIQQFPIKFIEIDEK